MDIIKRYCELSETDRRKVDLLMCMLENDERKGVLQRVWYDYERKLWRADYVRLEIIEESRLSDIPLPPE